ncbi:MAG: hypothetical protein QXI12_01485 [Candidatus Methanomethyliaceae archaeon]
MKICTVHIEYPESPQAAPRLNRLEALGAELVTFSVEVARIGTEVLVTPERLIVAGEEVALPEHVPDYQAHIAVHKGFEIVIEDIHGDRSRRRVMRRIRIAACKRGFGRELS